MAVPRHLINQCDISDIKGAKPTAANRPKIKCIAANTPILPACVAAKKLAAMPKLAPVISEISNLILPPNEFGSINDAEVPELIEFMAKDIPSYEAPLKDGLASLNQHSNKKFKKVFVDCDENQQKSILDLMAYPDPNLSSSEQTDDIKWFTLFRNLTMTGYYTSKVGIKELGYKGNTPNVWDGVPQDVLDQYGLSYDQDWLAKCVDQTKRNDVAEWDDQGNLVT